MSQKRIRSEKLREIVSQVRNGEFPYEKKEEQAINFSAYNEAQVNEIVDVLEMIREVVEEAERKLQQKEEHKGAGRPGVSASDLAKALMLQSYFGVSNRVAAGYVKLFKEKLNISKDFTYKTIERGYDPERTKQILNEVFKIINEKGNNMETVFSIDGTGDPTSMKVNYESKRAEQRRNKDNEKTGNEDSFPGKKHDFQYSVFTVGINTKLIAGYITTDDHSIGENSHFPGVLKDTYGNCPQINTILGDGIYANRKSCAVAENYKITPFFLPKSNVTFKSRGVKAWKDMLHRLVNDPQTWLSSYHGRSMSEAVNSMMKRRMPAKIRKKLPQRKRTEEVLKINVHNVRQYCYLRYLAPELLENEGSSNLT